VIPRRHDAPAAQIQPATHLAPAARVAVLAAMAVLALGLAALVGVWAGHRATPVEHAGPRPTVVRIGAAELTVSAGWRAASLSSAGIPGLPAGRTLAFASSPGLVGRAVVLFAPVDDASLVPQPLRRLLAGARLRSRAARLGGLPAWSYGQVSATGSDRLIGVTVMPTTSGVVAIACTAPEVERIVMALCDSGVDSVALRGATALVPSPSLATALRLPAVVHRLDRERVAHRAALGRAATANGQALAARRLAADYADAAAALRHPADRSGASLVQHLSSVRDAYAALARAAGARSVKAFRVARRAVGSAEAGLTDAVAGVPRPVTP
jgi:hypothetical protein